MRDGLTCSPLTRRRIVVLMAIPLMFFLAGCRKEEALPEEDPFRAFMYRNRMDGTLFSRNEDRVLYAYSTQAGVNVYVYDTNSGQASKITESKTGARPVSFYADDQIMYTDQPEGESVNHLYLRNRDGGVTDLTPWPNVQSVFYQWGGRHQTYYFGSNKEDRRFLYVYRVDPIDRLPSTVLQTQDMRFIAASPDHRYLALWKYASLSKSDVYLYDIEQKLLAKVAPESGAGVAVPQFFDGPKRLYYLSDASGGPIDLMLFDVEAQKHQKMSITVGGSMVYARQSPSGRLLVIGFMKEGTLRSSVLRKGKDGFVPLLSDQPGAVLDISSSEKWLLHDSLPQSTTRGLKIVNLETLRSRNILPD